MRFTRDILILSCALGGAALSSCGKHRNAIAPRLAQRNAPPAPVASGTAVDADPAPTDRFLATSIESLPSGTLTVKVVRDVSVLLVNRDKVLQNGAIIDLANRRSGIVRCAIRADHPSLSLPVGSRATFSRFGERDETFSIDAPGSPWRLECRRARALTVGELRSVIYPYLDVVPTDADALAAAPAETP